MIVLGITGGIGAGKSFIANEFSKKGIPVYNSDNRAKMLMNTNTEIIKSLTSKFGNEVYINNALNRPFLANKIFKNKELINWVNQLVHPIVANDFEQWCNKQEKNIVIKEAAILIESGAYKQCNKLIIVTAPKHTRIKRVCQRDNMTPEQVTERMNNQISDNERLKFADFVINNDGTVVVEEEINKILDILNQDK